MNPLFSHLTVAILVAASGVGCGKRAQTEAPWSEVVQDSIVSAHSDLAGRGGVPVRLVSMQRSRDAFTVELTSEDGACRFTASGQDTNGAVTIDRVIEEQCNGQSRRSVEALIVPRNKPAQTERCTSFGDEKARLQCVVHMMGESRALALVVRS